MSPAPQIDPAPDMSEQALQALHGDFLYFNVAGSGPTFPAAQDAAERFRRWLNEVGMFSHAGYDAYNLALAETRADVAAFIGDPGGSGRIALMQSATDALNIAVAGLDLPKGSLIVTTREEHVSALLPVYARQSRGDRIAVLPFDDVSEFLAEVERLRPAAILMSLVSCRTGRVLEVPPVAAAARRIGARLIVDAAQAAGQIPVDVTALGADAVALLGHKWLHGPLATGALWVREPEAIAPTRLGWRSRVTHDLHGNVELQPDATRFETGTVDVAAFVGLRQSLVIQRALADRVAHRLTQLRRALLARLGDLPFEIRSRAEDPTGIVSIVPRGGDSAGIVTRMWTEERIVIKHLVEPESPEGIRLSFWVLHTEGDIDRLCTALARQCAVRA